MSKRAEIVPWDLIGGMDAPTGAPGEHPNEPSPLGRIAGAQLARLLGDVPDCCHDCAARAGSRANGCAATVLDFVECAAEGIPFYCHVEDRPCAGYVEARRQFAARPERPRRGEKE